VRRRFLVLFAVLLTASAGAAEPPGVDEAYAVDARVGREPRLGRQVFDAVALRPLGLIQTLVGAALLVPLYPVSWVVDGGEDLLRACVSDPFERTFRRPLGSS
jgi:hypothetical protein